MAHHSPNTALSPPRGFPELDSYDTELPNYDSAVMFAAEDVSHDSDPVVAVLDVNEITIELGLWIEGLICFPRVCLDSFHDRSEGGSHDRSREFRISMMGLQRCSSLALNLRKLLDEDGGASAVGSPLSVRDIERLTDVIRGLIALNRSLSGASGLRPGQWRSWSATLEHQLGTATGVNRLKSLVRDSGRSVLPAEMAAVFARPELSFSDRSDIDELASQIGRTLRSLDIIERMLQSRMPLKPSLLIFATIHEQTGELLNFINNRLSRFPDEQAALFNSLDAASYGASLELKKVFHQELRGIVRLVPPPSVHARVETAHALLLDTFQQMLVEMARVVDANTTPFDFFPRFEVKRGQSIQLRKQLWEVFRKVQSSESDPSRENVSDLRTMLATFSAATLAYLHFKDQETIERFSEEIYAARDKKDLVPVLHRFGAYMETLFGQVSMRGVLAGHPFERSN